MSEGWRRPVSVRRLRAPEVLRIAATDEERQSLAAELDLQSLDSLEADITVRPWRKEGVKVEGRVQAALTQTCGVTLDPVKGAVDVRFERRFDPSAASDTAVVVDPEGEDPPEPLETDTIDVGEIALEHFILGIDPYPRSPNAVFDDSDVAPEKEPSPFAVLAALKNGT